MAQINLREMICKTLNKYITVLNYADKSLLVFSGTGIIISLFSFTTITDISVGISSASISLVFLVTNGFVKLFLKTMGNTKNRWVFESLRKQNVFESNAIIW